MNHGQPDLGPLFAWRPDVPDGRTASETETSTVSRRPGRPDVPDGSGQERPDAKKVRTPNSPMITGTALPSGVSPPTGGFHPDGKFLPVPSDSSAALTLRSQRTGQGDEGLPALNPDRRDQLQKPIEKPSRRPNPRPYQLDCLSSADRAFAAGLRRVLAVLATGLGKTVIFAEWALGRVALGRRVLVVAHRTELLEQAQKKLGDVGLWAAIEQAEKRAGLAPVVVASVQSLKGKRLQQFDPDEFDLVIDEAHHATSPSYRAIVDHFHGLVFGLTATARRGDGQALGSKDGGVFEECVYQFDIRDGIKAGFLVPIRAKQIHVDGVDLSTVRSRAGDLAQDELAAIMATEQAVLGVVDPLLREVGTRRTIVFTVDVAHAMAICEALERYRSGCARYAHGEMTRDQRTQILEDYRAGHFQFLVNCQLYTEGFDEPTIQCVATCRPTKSWALVVQQVGRGTRLLGLTIEESRANGKLDLLWLDFTGNAGRHKLISPLDALAAGEVADDVREEAERMLAEDACDLHEVLDEAQARIEERRRAAKVTVSARYFAHDVDPFLGEQLGPPCHEPWANDPALPDQVIELFNLGMKKTPPTLTRGEATRIIAAHRERKRLGLASFKQCAQLRRVGVDANRMTIKAANLRMQILAECDWDPARARARITQLVATEMLKADGDST